MEIGAICRESARDPVRLQVGRYDAVEAELQMVRQRHTHLEALHERHEVCCTSTHCGMPVAHLRRWTLALTAAQYTLPTKPMPRESTRSEEPIDG